MPGNPHVRFDEGRVGRHLGARPLSYSTVSAVNGKLHHFHAILGTKVPEASSINASLFTGDPVGMPFGNGVQSAVEMPFNSGDAWVGFHAYVDRDGSSAATR